MSSTIEIHEIRGFLLTGEEIADMRTWLGDSTWACLDEADVAGLVPQDIVAGVQQHYPGGVRRFLDDTDI